MSSIARLCASLPGHNNIELLLRDTHLFFDKLRAFIAYVRANPNGNTKATKVSQQTRSQSESSFACCAASRPRESDTEDESKHGAAVPEAKQSLLGAAAGAEPAPMKIEAMPQWR